MEASKPCSTPGCPPLLTSAIMVGPRTTDWSGLPSSATSAMSANSWTNCSGVTLSSSISLRRWVG